MIITNNTTIDLRYFKKADLQFVFDAEFADTDTFKLEVGDIESENYGFTNAGNLCFARVDFSTLTNASNTLTYKVYKNGVQIETGTITVNLQGGSPAGVIFNNVPALATQVQVTADTSEVTNFSYMFYQCENLLSIQLFNVSSGLNCAYMFAYCTNTTKIPNFQFYAILSSEFMFQGCQNLKDLSNVYFGQLRACRNMFYNCKKLQKIPALNVENVSSTLTNIFGGCNALKDFGGLLNCKISYNLSECSLLTHDSLINCINGLADLTGETAQTLTLGATNLAKLSEQEIALATAKNWILN